MTETAEGDIANAAQIAYWNEVAGAKWVANQDRLDRLMAPLSEALLGVAAPRAGERVVDIGTGCGDLALKIADLVGARGHVLAVDISQPMLAHAEVRRRRLPVGERAAIAWRQADAMTETFGPNADLLVSRFGVMFFEDPGRAFANLRGALRPGGRFAVLTWRRREGVEWMQAPVEWVAPKISVPDDVPGEIGPFAFAEPDPTCRMLAAAGFKDVAVTPVDCDLVVGSADPHAADPDRSAVADAMVILAETGPAARQLREAEPGDRAAALDCLLAGVARHVRDGRVILRGACWIYSGTTA